MFAYRRSLRKGHSPNFHYLTRAITGKRDLVTSLSRDFDRKVRFFSVQHLSLKRGEESLKKRKLAVASELYFRDTQWNYSSKPLKRTMLNVF